MRITGNNDSGMATPNLLVNASIMQWSEILSATTDYRVKLPHTRFYHTQGIEQICLAV